MVQRLLLDRIDAEAGRAAVAGELHPLAVLARAPHEAQASLPRAHAAEARTELAPDPPVLELRPILDIDAIIHDHSASAAFARPLLNSPDYVGSRAAIAMRRSGAAGRL